MYMVKLSQTTSTSKRWKYDFYVGSKRIDRADITLEQAINDPYYNDYIGYHIFESIQKNYYATLRTSQGQTPDNQT